MQPFSTHVFRFVTLAGPALVWSALTDQQAGALYGMSLTITCEPGKWEPGAALHLALTEEHMVIGTILFVAGPRRVSYSFDDPSGPTTYLTWEIRPTSTGSIVRLSVDDSEGTTDEDAEAVWLPVVDRLQADLTRRHVVSSPDAG